MKKSDSMRVFIKTRRDWKQTRVRLASPYHAFCICIHKNNLVSDAKRKDNYKLQLKMQIWKNDIIHSFYVFTEPQ